MSDLRPEWTCTDCSMRLYNARGEPIPEPWNWADEHCPHCRVKRTMSADGHDAANELSIKLGLSRRRNSFNKKGREPGRSLSSRCPTLRRSSDS